MFIRIIVGVRRRFLAQLIKNRGLDGIIAGLGRKSGGTCRALDLGFIGLVALALTILPDRGYGVVSFY